MTLYQTFLLIYIFILSVNGMIMVVDAQLNIGITTPFDINSSISGETPPSIFDPANPSGTLTEDVTTDVDDGGGNVFTALIDTVAYPIQVAQSFIGVLTGAFIFDVLAMLGFPVIFGQMMQGIIGFLLVITIVHYVTGRG